MAQSEQWKTKPEESDYTAAAHYLGLLLDKERAEAVARRLAKAPLTTHRANDLLRASHLPLLPCEDPEVAKDLKKVKKGKPLSPVLLVRGALGHYGLTVADGYHRICASYHLDEDTEIPCRLVDLPDLAASPSPAGGSGPASSPPRTGRKRAPAPPPGR
ncbi:MAG: hypothetical protein NVSMB32_09700 [Actinomycetota bacterium]